MGTGVFEEYLIRVRGKKKCLILTPAQKKAVLVRRVSGGLLFWVMNGDGGASFQEIPLICEGWEFYIISSEIQKDFFSSKRIIILNLSIKLEDREFDPYDLVKDIPEKGFYCGKPFWMFDPYGVWKVGDYETLGSLPELAR